MPEGDTIARLARDLRAALVGRTVQSSKFMTPQTALVDLSGRSCDAVISVGKHLLLRFGGDVTLHVHLRMDGRLRMRGAVASARSRSTYSHTVRFVIAFDEVELVGDRVPVVEILPTAGESQVVGHLGPDLCGSSWDGGSAAVAVTRLGRRPERAVIEAVLDQRNMAGVGNVWAVESCFLLGLYPWTPVADAGDLHRIVALERRLLVSGLRIPGHVTTGDRRRGHTHWVYGRSGEPCRRCGVPITMLVGRSEAARTTWWCPTCQPP
jgi:endonuclease-8